MKPSLRERAIESASAGRRKISRHWGLAGAFVVILVWAAAFIDWPVTRATERQPQLVFIGTGEVDGFVDQCGCSRYPLGGLDRRAGYLTRLRRMWPGSVNVLVDVGNFSDLPGPAGDVKTRGVIEGMNRLGYRAAGVGERDLKGGVAHLLSNTRDARFPLLSANLVHRESRQPWLSPATIIVAGKIKVGVLAVTRFNPSLRIATPEGDRLVTADPLEALGKHLPQLREECDLIVVLAAMPLEDARILARRLDGVDLILGAHGSRVTDYPVLEGRTRIVYCGDEGKSVAQVAVFRGMTGALSLETKVIQLLETIKPDPMMERHVVEVLAEAQDAEQLQLTAIDPSGGARTSSKFVGSGRCASCHEEIVAEWAEGGHARAMETLEREPGGFKANCVSCHVTGYAQPGGYVDARVTPHLVGVGCEACHGPAAGHIADVERPYGKTSISSCTGCHTSEFDESFNYYEDRLAVSHGAR